MSQGAKAWVVFILILLGCFAIGQISGGCHSSTPGYETDCTGYDRDGTPEC